MERQSAGIDLSGQGQRGAVEAAIAAVFIDNVEVGNVFDVPRFELREVLDFPGAEIERRELFGGDREVRPAGQAHLEVPFVPGKARNRQHIASRETDFTDRLGKIWRPAMKDDAISLFA